MIKRADKLVRYLLNEPFMVDWRPSSILTAAAKIAFGEPSLLQS
jgi:hypothetical protein